MHSGALCKITNIGHLWLVLRKTKITAKTEPQANNRVGYNRTAGYQIPRLFHNPSAQQWWGKNHNLAAYENLFFVMM